MHCYLSIQWKLPTVQQSTHALTKAMKGCKNPHNTANREKLDIAIFCSFASFVSFAADLLFPRVKRYKKKSNSISNINRFYPLYFDGTNKWKRTWSAICQKLRNCRWFFCFSFSFYFRSRCTQIESGVTSLNRATKKNNTIRWVL